MPLSDEDVAALRVDLERVQRERETALRADLERMQQKQEAAQAELDRVQREKEAGDAANREYGMKFRRERSVGTSFDERGGGGSADRLGTAAPTMSPMWTRGVSTGGGLGQSLPYVPRGTVPKFPMECPPYVYIAWERRFDVYITNQGLGHTTSPDAPQIAVISCAEDAYLLGISARPLSRSTDGHGGSFVKQLPAPLSKIVFTSVNQFLML